VTNRDSGTVSTIDVKTRTKNPDDIAVGANPKGVAVTPDGKTAFVTKGGLPSGEVDPATGSLLSFIDVRTRTKDPKDITVGLDPWVVAFTPDGKTAFVTNNQGGSVSTIDVTTRTKDPSDIIVGSVPAGVTFGSIPIGVGVTPDGKTAFVANAFGGSVSTIDVKTRTKNPDDIAVGPNAFGLALTPDGKTAFVTQGPGGDSVSTIDVKTKTKNPTDIPVGAYPNGVAVTPCRR
jgi:YVTN family beta-propeller protein